MVLKLHDFAGWRINWRDKAANILDLMTELNLGLDSAVFIDDSPVERARVRERCLNSLSLTGRQTNDFIAKPYFPLIVSTARC